MIVDHLKDLLEVGQYAKGDTSFLSDENSQPKNLNSEVDFWDTVLHSRPAAGFRVTIETVCITEWLPYSPGQYHTERARRQRLLALRQIDSITDRPDGTKLVEFNPYGKASMVSGGIGSLRLAPKDTGMGLVHFLGASSSGYSYKGFPVAFDANCYDRLESDIRARGYSWGRLVGELRILPSTDDRIQYPRRMPRYYLLASDFTRSAEVDTRPTASAQIIYGTTQSAANRKSWCFTHFKPSRHDSELYAGIEWMEDYARRNSRKAGGDISIISDFDELHNHFADVEFPLRDAVHYKLNMPRLRHYVGTYINIDRLNMENYSVGNVENSTVVIKSSVKGSFNSLPGNLHQAALDAMKKIGEHINENGNMEAAELYEQISEELRREQPRRSIIRSLWTGIKEVLPTVATIIGVAEGMEKLTS
ncbi:hypothetical protein [Solwaraspora sp. WMMD792]|uniref:hypothetical protein n=1 Tax=Solwaraspora sp. WMMD792 TaxID=3016099 RepID=UPI002416CB8B|nr:hypothetical protein [Solwaraspora sp. WMMD792]MDG4771840.1 hypothetical protein [Solwaraspora sp. WMMD792]